ncbi:MAG: hypothetical protein K2O89_06735 [Clostridia bacterium]|nr:hypothetical protein [Clostridia bacterium]
MTNNIDPVEIEKIEIENTNEIKPAKTEKVKAPKNPVIQNDISRYKKNKFAANLALLGLALGCIYFLSLYSQVNNEKFYYTWAIAFDVIYNLFFLLFVFLFSEQVKNYKRKLFPFQLVLGALQIARIFWLPLSGIMAEKIDIGSFLLMTIALAASGACIIASAVIGFIRAKAVEDFEKKVENGEIDLEGELKKEENAGGEVNA